MTLIRQIVASSVTVLVTAGPMGALNSGLTAPRVQLPRSVTPEHYEITIKPDMDLSGFQGSAVVDIQVHQRTRKIVFNAADLVFERVVLDGSGAPETARNPSTVALDTRRETATLTFAEQIAPGRHRLAIDYRGKIYRKAQGLFLLTYDTERGPDHMLATQFEASDARRFMPSWDEPALKATFTLSAIVPRGRMAVSNMPIVATSDIEGGLQSVHFEKTPQMSSYLLFLGIGDLERQETDIDGTKLALVTKRGDAEKARFALQTAAGLLRYYNEYCGIPYPLPKLDLIAAPGVGEFGFHAMENWGAILYFEDVLLIDPRLSTEADRQRVSIFIAHEMAHQWFGDLVTMAWWDDLWLNEGFAEWMGDKATDHFHPEWRIWLQTESVRQGTMRQDAMSSTHPIVRPVLNPNQITFDNITYDKAQAVIRMLEVYLGSDALRDGVRAYMRKFAYGNATTGNLLAELEATAGKRIVGIANDFTRQPGVPLITTRTQTCNGGRSILLLRQGRLGLDAGSQRQLRWRTPVAAVAIGAREGTVALVAGPEVTPASVPGCAPVKINAGQTGYFRSAYATADFKALSGRFGDLDAADQLGLLYDSWALGEAGIAPVRDFLDLVRRATPAADPVIWRGIVKILGDIDALYADLPQQQNFRRFARATLAPVFASVGWDAKPGDADNIAVLREDLLNILGRVQDRDVLKEARYRFDEFLRQPASLPAGIWRSTLQIVAQEADAETYETIRALASMARSPLERNLLYEVLASARHSKLATRSLEIALSDDVPAATGLSMIQRVAVDNADLAWRFVFNHWARIKDRFVAEQRYEFAPSLAAQSVNPDLTSELRRFIDRMIPADARSSAEKSYSELIYRLKVRARRLPMIDRWLASGNSTVHIRPTCNAHIGVCGHADPFRTLVTAK